MIRDSRVDERTAADPKRLAEVLTRLSGDVRDEFKARGFSNIQWHESENPIAVPSTLSRVSAYGTGTSAQSLTNATETILALHTTGRDTHSIITSPTTAARFTVPTGYAGRYLIGGAFVLAGGGAPAANAVCYSVVKKNGTNVQRLGRADFNVGGGSASGSIILDLVAGDYIEFVGFQNGGGAFSTEAALTYGFLEQMSATTEPIAACWPYDFLADRAERPLLVTLANCTATDGTACNPHGLQWETLTKSGKPHIRVRNLAGLVAGKSYRLRFLVLWE